MKLVFGILKPQFVGAIYNPYDSISLLEIIPPIRADSFLSSNIPHVKLVVFVLQRFDIESKSGWNFIDILSIELFDDGGLACIVKSQYQQPHFLLLLFSLFHDWHKTHLAILNFKG